MAVILRLSVVQIRQIAVQNRCRRNAASTLSQSPNGVPMHTRQLAADIVNGAIEGNVQAIADAYGWPGRRINPAITDVARRRAIQADPGAMAGIRGFPRGMQPPMKPAGSSSPMHRCAAEASWVESSGQIKGPGTAVFT